MAGIAQAMRYGVVAWNPSTRDTAGHEQMAAVDGALRRLIEQAGARSFVGQPDQLAFTVPLPAGSPLPGQLADLALLVTPDGKLVMRWTPHLPGVPLRQAPPPQIEVLQTEVKFLHAQYLTPQPKGSTAWSDTWTQDGLALLVHIGLKVPWKGCGPTWWWPLQKRARDAKRFIGGADADSAIGPCSPGISCSW